MNALPFVREAFADSRSWAEDPNVKSHFPDVHPGVLPLGARVLCQLVSPRTVSAGGIVLVEETKETERWNNQVARVLAVGPLAFCNRETGKPWTEGMWAAPGDFVVIPRWGGQRRTVKDKSGNDPVFFVTCNDHEIIERIYGNPLTLETYHL